MGALATVSLMKGGPSGRLASESIRVGICMQWVTLKSTMWMMEKPSTASIMAALAAEKPNLCLFNRI